MDGIVGFSLYMHDVRYDNVTLIPLVLQFGSKIGLGGYVIVSSMMWVSNLIFSSKIIPSSLGVGSYLKL